MMKLERLAITKFRNVEPGTDLRFSDGLNVVLGQNGTGKTTLLELISSVARSDFLEFAKEEFDIEYRMALGEGTVTVHVRNEPARDPMTIRMAGEERFVTSMTATLVSADGETSVVSFEHGRLRVDGRDLTPVSDPPNLLGPQAIDGILIVRGGFPWLQALADGWGAVRFDESLDLFRRLMGPESVLCTTQVFEGDFLKPFRSKGPVPRDVMEEIERMHRADLTTNTFNIVASRETRGFLGDVVRMIGVSRAELRVDVIERRMAPHHGAGILDLGKLQLRVFHGDCSFLHDRLSYGQKRLLTFFFYLASNPDIVIADELVNGLHHEWIVQCIDAMGERQAFLTSQNPLLLDYLPFASVSQVQKSFVICESKTEQGVPHWRWANMSEAEAETFFAAYEVGIEHVSEILRTQGLF